MDYHTLVEPDVPTLANIVLNPDAPPGGPLNRNPEVGFSATAFDMSGNEIEDLRFRFYSAAQDGNGTVVSEAPNGRGARFAHAIETPVGRIYSDPGTNCEVVCRASIEGGSMWLVTLWS